MQSEESLPSQQQSKLLPIVHHSCSQHVMAHLMMVVKMNYWLNWWRSGLSPLPWLVIGDFNLIYQACDKNNLNLNRCLMGKFRRTLDDCELIKLTLQNKRYTWSNEQENPTLVRLDRAFCSSDWEVAFPDFALSAMSTGASDHCPLILSVKTEWYVKPPLDSRTTS